MGLSINQNIAAFNSYRNLSATQGSLGKSLEKLSSGFRINRAADDAAGLAISEGLRSQVGGLKVASRNAQDGISVVQTAEGALTETHAILQRMRDLSVQASNHGGLSTKAKENIQAEMGQLQSEITRIADTTQFNGTKLLDGRYNGTFQVGANVGESISVSVSNGTTTANGALNATGLGVNNLNVTTAATGATWTSTNDLQALESVTENASSVTMSITPTGGSAQSITVRAATGAGVSAPSMDTNAIVAAINTGIAGNNALSGKFTATNEAGKLVITRTFDPSLTKAGVGGADPTNASLAAFAVTATGGTGAILATDATGTEAAGTLGGSDLAIHAIDNAITTISTVRANLGAVQNRFEHTINNLNVAVENLSASESRIRDTDMASEMVTFTRNQILSQAGTAMLAQANQIPQGVLSLLR